MHFPPHPIIAVHCCSSLPVCAVYIVRVLYVIHVQSTVAVFLRASLPLGYHTLDTLLGTAHVALALAYTTQ